MSNETGKVLNMCQWVLNMNDPKGIEAAEMIMDLYDQVRQGSDDLGMVEAENNMLKSEVDQLRSKVRRTKDSYDREGLMGQMDVECGR